MNVLQTVRTPADAATIAHSVMAYDRATEELDLELPIPLFLDTLALKIAGVPSDDKYGALSYPLPTQAVDTFRFLLGLDVDMPKRDYFLEPTAGQVVDFGPRKLVFWCFQMCPGGRALSRHGRRRPAIHDFSPLHAAKSWVAGLRPPRRWARRRRDTSVRVGTLEAVELLTEVTPHPRYARTGKPRISERELVVPTLRLLDGSDLGWMATSDLIAQLAERFAPTGQDARILQGRRDTYFSQKVRNMISHRDEPSSFIHLGMAQYERNGLRISSQGRATLRALLS